MNNLLNLFMEKVKRKTILQRQVESMEAYLEKQHLYLAYKETIGLHRSSCSKTDTDANVYENER